ncbi:MAG: hypothetical protein M1570_07550 [Chloroflexi bacterium]|nr:hypothetical protein [Chloroflexota bacterium]
MAKRFLVLRVVGTLFKLGACIELALGVVVGGLLVVLGLLGNLGGLTALSDLVRALGLPSDLVALLFQDRILSILGGIGAVTLALWPFLLIYAGGEFIYLLIAIEENTRESTEWTATERMEHNESVELAPKSIAPPAPAAPLASQSVWEEQAPAPAAAGQTAAPAAVEGKGNGASEPVTGDAKVSI